MGKVKKLDPTVNAKEAMSAAVHRLDDLRLAEAQRIDQLREAETRRVNERMELQSQFERLLEEAETKRLDAIRAVDVNAARVADERATAAASVLAINFTARLDTLENSRSKSEGSGSGMRDMYGWIVVGLGLLLTGLLVYAGLHGK